MGISRSKRKKPSRASRPAPSTIDEAATRTSNAAKENKPAQAQNLLEKALARWENEGGLVLERSQPRPSTEPEASQFFPASGRAAAKSLRSNLLPYKAVLAAALDPIITIDSAGIIQSVSDSVQRVFGWTAAELAGRNVSVLMPEPHRSEHDRYLAEYHKTGRTEHLNRARRFEAMRKDGTFFPIEVCVSRVDVAGQVAPLFVGIIRDLSKHARVSGESGVEPGDEQLASAEDSSQLHELLAEQTSALQTAHLRLRMSDRMASIGALAAGLGHDMNNVLLPVRAHLNAARALTMLPEVRKHVTAVQKSVTYLQQLADALHFLALDTDGEDAERAATNVRAWWSQVGPLLTKAVPKHVKITVSIPKGLPEVAISAHGLTQAVLNLVVNAGQAMPAGREQHEGRVRIWAKAIDNGRRVRLGVTDNGVGMSAEVQRNAFEMFYTTKTRGLGTGLGLPLVARVVSRAGGSVQIESESGKGTTVEILLPVAGLEVQRSGAPVAIITLSDGRAAALIKHFLEAAGVRAALGTDPTDANIWIMEPLKDHAGGAKAWRKRHPRGGLILFGKPAPGSTAGSARTWKSLHPVTIEDTGDLDAIRAAISRAIAGS
jgi:PAS domain S-box-containing protein